MNCISDQTPSAAEVTEQQTASSLETMSETTNALAHLGMKQEALGTTLSFISHSVARLQTEWKEPVSHTWKIIAARLEECVGLFFLEPQQLLSIFTDLEDENLGLIQKCQGWTLRCSVTSTSIS